MTLTRYVFDRIVLTAAQCDASVDGHGYATSAVPSGDGQPHDESIRFKYDGSLLFIHTPNDETTKRLSDR